MSSINQRPRVDLEAWIDGRVQHVEIPQYAMKLLN